MHGMYGVFFILFLLTNYNYIQLIQDLYLYIFSNGKRVGIYYISEHEQLFNHQLFPSTFDRQESAFTLDVLDYYLIDSVKAILQESLGCQCSQHEQSSESRCDLDCDMQKGEW